MMDDYNHRMLSRSNKGKRLYLINRDFQLRYTKIAVIVGLCSTLLTLTLILLPLFQLNILRFPNFVPYPFVVAMAVAALLNFFIIAALGVLITHRIAGPMFSLVRHIRAVQLGRLTGPLKVRDSDDLKYLVRNFNEMLEFLVNVVRKDRDVVDSIIEALKRPGSLGVSEAMAMAEGLRDDLEKRLPVKDAGGGTQTETP